MNDPLLPEVYILLATYNGEDYLAGQIESIRMQSHEKWKLIISDDGSHDKTTEIIQSYAEKDARICWMKDHPSCKNARDNFLYLAKMFCDQPYIMFCDQDDVWHETKVQETLARIMALEGRIGTDVPALVFSDATLVDEKGELIAPSSMLYQHLDASRVSFKQLLIQNAVPGCTLMMNSALCKKAVCFKETDNIAMHDWWCALVAARFGHIEYIDHATMAYRQHSTNTVGVKQQRTFKLFYDRITNPESIRYPIRLSKMQAKAFYRTYAGELLPTEQKMLRQFADHRRNGPLFYIRYGLLKKGIIANIPVLLMG